MSNPTDPMDGPPTRPDIPEPVRRRRRTSQVRAAVARMAQGSEPPAPHESYSQLRARLLDLQRARIEDSELLAAMAKQRDAAENRAAALKRELDDLRASIGRYHHA